MKECLKGLLSEVWRNLYWLILALAFALMLWLAPKVNATPLDDYLKEHKLEYPCVVHEQVFLQDLVAACGILSQKDQTFTVYFMKRSETVQEFDIHKALMKVRFFLKKIIIIVEYQKAILWNANEYKIVIVHLEFYPL